MPALSWNTIEHRPGVARVRGKWSAWLDSGNRWKQLQPRFRETPDGFAWTAGPAEYHIGRHLADGARIVSNNRFDIFNRQPITAAATEFELNPIGGANVAAQFDAPAALVANYPHVQFAADQSQVWNPEAGGPGLHVRWTIHHGRAPRMTRELVVDPKACPQRDLSLAWDVRSPRVLALVRNQSGQLARPWNGSPGDFADVPSSGVAIVAVPDQSAADQLAAELAAGATETALRRGAGIRPPLVWYWKQDGSLVTAPATVRAEIQSDGETVRFTKTIDLATIQAAAAENSYVVSDDSQTIYPDPQWETTTWDGHVGARDGDWPTVIAKAGHSSYSASHQTTAGITYDTGTVSNYRFISLFDVSSLSGQSVESANWHAVRTGGYNRDVRLTAATTASNTGHTITDYENTFNDHDSDLTAAFQLDDTPVALNAGGITHLQSAVDGTGIAKFCCRSNLDYIGSTSGPGGGSTTYVLTAENSGTTNDPYLEVTYGAAGGAASRSGSLSPGICIRC